ncbi:MAG: peroxidase [Planctomycetes bacterium]|nr:peroxidase [Planctomycetota bacterium]
MDPAAFADDIAAQGSEAAPTPRLRAILRHAERLALQPASVTADHLDELRAHGLDDRALTDLTQAAAYFAYINRVADGLGVDPEA